jgi:hypothetical protein
MTWLGVGNVEGVVLRADKHAIPARENIQLFPGVVGYQLPSVRSVVTPLSPDDAQLIARGICRKHCKRTDDGLVLVARVRERPLSAALAAS